MREFQPIAGYRPVTSGTWFFSHASYEERCLGVPQQVAIPIERGFVFYSQDACDRAYLKNKEALVGALGGVDEIACVRERSAQVVLALHDLVGADFDKMETAAIDITTFPRDRLLILLDYIWRVAPTAAIELFYCSPASYASENERWLSRGVRKIFPVPGFNGHQSVRKKHLLALLVGHERERINITLKNVEPDAVVLLAQGEEQYKAGVGGLPEGIVDFLQHEYGHKIISPTEYLSFRSVDGVEEALTSMYERFASEYNISVSANGTKPQCVGAFKFCRKMRRAQLVYSRPQAYNAISYSSGIGAASFYTLRPRSSSRASA